MVENKNVEEYLNAVGLNFFLIECEVEWEGESEMELKALFQVLCFSQFFHRRKIRRGGGKRIRGDFFFKYRSWR